MKKMILAMCLCVPAVCVAKPHHKQEKLYGSATVEHVNSIYDADTFRVNIKGWPDIVGKNIPIRADGFDAPEIRGKCAKEKNEARQARQLTVDFLQKGEKIELKNMRRGKFFRIIADVYVDGHSLKDMQINSGLSREYHGGKRAGWCDYYGNKKKTGELIH